MNSPAPRCLLDQQAQASAAAPEQPQPRPLGTLGSSALVNSSEPRSGIWSGRGARRGNNATTPRGPQVDDVFSDKCAMRAGTETERAPQEPARDDSRHPSLLGALVLRACYVTARSWEPWCSEIVTLPLALGNLGVQRCLRCRSLLGALVSRIVYVTVRSWEPCY